MYVDEEKKSDIVKYFCLFLVCYFSVIIKRCVLLLSWLTYF